jgi:hypothetical protein
MEIELRPIEQITPYPGNPRLNDDAVDAVAASIREFGFRQAIVVDGNGVIVCGHTRYKAATRLGLGKVPVHIARDLTPDQVKGYGSPITGPRTSPNGITISYRSSSVSCRPATMISACWASMLMSWPSCSLPRSRTVRAIPTRSPLHPTMRRRSAATYGFSASIVCSAAIPRTGSKSTGCSMARPSISSTPIRPTTLRSSRARTTR